MHGWFPFLPPTGAARRLLGLGALCAALSGCAVCGSPPLADFEPEAAPDLYTEQAATDAAHYARQVAAGTRDMSLWPRLAQALAASRAYAAARPGEDVAVAKGSTTILWSDVVRTLDSLAEVLPRLEREPELLAARFRWLRLTPGVDFSGYYEPLIKASLKREGAYAHPLYGPPPDMRTLDLGAFAPDLIGRRLVYRQDGDHLVPYYSREAIDEQGVLRGRGLELAYVADPLDAYFLQIQGSGRLVLPDGREQPVHFAAANGRRYLGIGRWLKDRGLLAEKASMESVRAWLRDHPDKARTVMNLNERYVFFRLSDQEIVGGMGSALTPWISLAVDRNVLPLGAPVAYSVEAPFPGGKTQRITALGLAQDTGSAIRGRRVDIFCGKGKDAAHTAGRLNKGGDAWLLVARDNSE
jgi:membrane-bound lytic murein transglycosylase A